MVVGRNLNAVWDQRLQLILVSFKMLETIVAKRGQSFEDDNYGVEQVSSGETLSCLCVELHVFGQDLEGKSIICEWLVLLLLLLEYFM